MNTAVLELNQALVAAKTKAQFFAAGQKALLPFGVTDFNYGMGHSAPMRVDVFHVTLPDDIQRHLQGNQRFEQDLTMHRAAAGKDTCWLDHGLWDKAPPSMLRAVARDLDMGFHIGYTRVLSAGPAKRAIGLHMDALRADAFTRHWGELSQVILPMVQLMDDHFMREGIKAHYALTPRERDVLSWLAMGLRPDQIADRLDVGYRTVDKYVVSAKAKLSAKTRDHAVARALMLGLLEL